LSLPAGAQGESWALASGQASRQAAATARKDFMEHDYRGNREQGTKQTRELEKGAGRIEFFESVLKAVSPEVRQGTE
jgi:hypothetical protein